MLRKGDYVAKDQSRLRGLRAERKITMEEMAKIIDVTPLTYSKKERGISEFTLPEAVIISKFLGIEISEIFLN